MSPCLSTFTCTQLSVGPTQCAIFASMHKFGGITLGSNLQNLQSQCPDWDQVCSLVISHFGVERLDALLYISYLSNVCEAV